MYCQSNNWWRFCKVLWPSQNIWTLCILQNFPSNSDTAHHVKSKLNMCPTGRTLKERLKNKIPTTLPTTYSHCCFRMSLHYCAQNSCLLAWFYLWKWRGNHFPIIPNCCPSGIFTALIWIWISIIFLERQTSKLNNEGCKEVLFAKNNMICNSWHACWNTRWSTYSQKQSHFWGHKRV